MSFADQYRSSLSEVEEFLTDLDVDTSLGLCDYCNEPAVMWVNGASMCQQHGDWDYDLRGMPKVDRS